MKTTTHTPGQCSHKGRVPGTSVQAVRGRLAGSRAGRRERKPRQWPEPSPSPPQEPGMLQKVATPKCSLAVGQINKWWHSYSMKCHLAIDRNGPLTGHGVHESRKHDASEGSQPRRPRAVRFCLHEMSRAGKCMQTESGFQCQGLGGGSAVRCWR